MKKIEETEQRQQRVQLKIKNEAALWKDNEDCEKREHLQSNFNQHKRPKRGSFLLLLDLKFCLNCF